MRLSVVWSGCVMGFIVSLPVWLRAGEPARSPASPGRPPLLDDAFQAFLAHEGRWAYTETRFGIRADGTHLPESIVRFDPSQPHVNQFTPVKLSGRAPSDEQRKQWAERGEAHARRRLVGASPAAPTETEFRLRIGIELGPMRILEF